MSLLGGCGNPFLKKERRYFFILLFATQIFLSSALLTPVYSRTWHIKPDGTGDAPTIQAGIDSAFSGDTVLVAPGIYSDTREMLVDGVPRLVNVHLYKNVKLITEGAPSNTTIDGSQSKVAVYVTGVDSTAELRGFKIQTQFYYFLCADNAAYGEPDFQIGIRCDSSSILITQNEIVDNGIAVELRQQSPVTFTDNVFYRSLYGIRCYDGSDALIQGNTLHECAQLVLVERAMPQILDNEMYDACSAVDCNADGSPYVSGNQIYDIHARAIICGDASPIIEDNYFKNNSSGIYLSSFWGMPIVRRNVFYHHYSYAIHLSDNPNAIIENNTIDDVYGWSAFVIQRGSNPIIRNNIITRSGQGFLCLLSSFPTFECNNLFAVAYPYTGDCTDQTGINGNISQDPQFCGVDDSGNYFLQSDSPCAPGNHPDGINCGVIGAYDVGCGTTPTAKSTWGAIKSRYVKEEKK